MSEHYIPFDFGAWSTKTPADKPMICSKHGAQEGGFLISVTPRRGQSTFRRKYCGMCVLEALDQVTEGLTDGS
jgi:hypothetical protein